MKILSNMKKISVLFLAVAAIVSSCCGPKDGEYTFRILTTNDIHGHYFDSLYLADATAPSVYALAWQIDSVRVADGAENVILIDAGDSMHGDNASYYYNYVDTVSKHVFARMLEYLEYDAWVPGNHDFETGHPVYDRVAETLEVPILASNAIRTDDGLPYFQEYVTVKRQGLKFTVIGFTNPNIKNAYAPELWSGIDFESLMPDFAQTVVDRVKAKENPDVVIVAIHSGAGRGDGAQLEQQGLDLFNSLKGVDLIVSSHDHRANVYNNETIAMVNTGNYCANLGYCTLDLKVENGKVVSKTVSAELLPTDKDKVHKAMQEHFRPDFMAVKNYITREVGEVKMDLKGMDALRGMSDYMNLLHTVCLDASDARVSFAAPQSTNLDVKAGMLVYNDLFTLYSYENQLYTVKMTGKEIKDYLEHSYEGWINTLDRSQDHVLKMRSFRNPRTGSEMYFFAGTASNMDSAGGLVYDVDVTRPFGERIVIRSLADGTAFDESAEYKVAMNSYRALGGGDLLKKAGIGNTDDRVLGIYPDIRTLLNDYIAEHTPVDQAMVSDKAVLGEWKFVPVAKADKAFDRDMKLMGSFRW